MAAGCHQLVLNVREQASTVHQEGAMQKLDRLLCRAEQVPSLVHTGNAEMCIAV